MGRRAATKLVRNLLQGAWHEGGAQLRTTGIPQSGTALLGQNVSAIRPRPLALLASGSRAAKSALAQPIEEEVTVVPDTVVDAYGAVSVVSQAVEQGVYKNVDGHR
jgi:hypothetical protein